MDLLQQYVGPDVLDHYSDGGYLSLLAPLALLPPSVLAGTPRVLVIGGGAGQLATTLATHFALQTDVLEPDAAVIRLARRHFGFDAPVWRDGAQVHPGSARYARVRILETDALRFLRGLPASERCHRRPPSPGSRASRQPRAPCVSARR